MNELISVVVPVYNHSKGLTKSLFSLSRQTYKPLETIIVNDGSTDGIHKVLEGLSESQWFKELNCKVVDQDNRGASSARNRGFRESTGEYVLFWDADTLAQPEMIEQMHSALQANQAASYAYSQFRFGLKKIRSRVFDAGELKKVNYIDTTSLLRRSAFVPFDERLKRFQDWDLWLTLLEGGHTGVFIPKVLFSKMTAGRRGISSWLPKFMYRLPFKTAGVIDYEAARKLVLQKHHLA